jgi:pyruvate dehydrogenase E2 component (dihydrolipoamide acetyltransferase)
VIWHRVKGTGPKGRITHADVQNHIKAVMSGAGSSSAQAARSGSAGLDLLPWPSLDFAKFGATELLPLSRIKKISGPNLHRNWVMIPHVTQYDEADVTELEELRKSSNDSHGEIRRQADHPGIRHQGQRCRAEEISQSSILRWMQRR